MWCCTSLLEVNRMSWFCVVGAAGIVCVGVCSVVGAAGAGELEEAEFTSLPLGAGSGLASLKRISP